MERAKTRDPIVTIPEYLLVQHAFKGRMQGNFQSCMSVSTAWRAFFLRPSPLWEDFWLRLVLSKATDQDVSSIRWLDTTEHEPIVRCIRRLRVTLQRKGGGWRHRGPQAWEVLTSVLQKCQLSVLSITTLPAPGEALQYHLLTRGLLDTVGELASLECLSLLGVYGDGLRVRRSLEPLACLSGLQELFLTTSIGTSPLSQKTLSGLTKLRRLALRGDIGGKDEHTQLREDLSENGFGAFGTFSRLEALEVPLAGALVASMSGLTKLTTLVLTFSQEVWDREMAKLELPTTLLELRLNCPSLPPTVADCRALRRLELNLVHVTTEVTIALSSMPDLEELRICHKEPRHLDTFLPWLSELPKLRVLNDVSVIPPRLDLQEFWACSAQLQALALAWLDHIPPDLAKATSLEILHMSSATQECDLEQALVLARLPRLKRVVLMLRSREPKFHSSLKALLESEAPHVKLETIDYRGWPDGTLGELCVGPSEAYQF